MRRRDFFKMMSIASGAALTACKIDNADRRLLPYLVPPEDGIIPGTPRYITGTCLECPASCGLRVKIRDDRPVKLEGNENHPINKGKLCMRGQASLSRLYNPERFTAPMLKQKDGSFKAIGWEEAVKVFRRAMDDVKGKGLRNVFLSGLTTGTLDGFIDGFCGETGLDRLKEVEVMDYGPIKGASRRLFNRSLLPTYGIDRADVLITVGADLLETFLSPVEWHAQIGEARSKNSFKWFHIEPNLSLTGAASDLRIPCKPGSEPYLLAFLLKNISLCSGLPAGILQQIPGVTKKEVCESTGIGGENIEKLVESLEKSQRPLVISGGPSIMGRNGDITAIYTLLLQWSLGMIGRTVDMQHGFSADRVGTMDDLYGLKAAIEKNTVGLVLFSRFHGYDTLPHLFSFLEKVSFKVVLSQVPSGLTRQCDLVLPLAHPLESWGDTEPRRGLRCLIQPAASPLGEAKSEGDILSALSGKGFSVSYRDYMIEVFKSGGIDEEWVSKGFKIDDTTADNGAAKEILNWEKEIKLELPGGVYKGETLYIIPSIRGFDGRSMDIPLLREIPDPLSSISYGRWLTISQQLAQRLKLEMGDIVEVEMAVEPGLEKALLRLPAYINPGLPGGVATLYMDCLGDMDLSVGENAAFSMFCREGAVLRKTGERERLAMLSASQITGKRHILPDEEENAVNRHNHKKGHSTLYPEHEHKGYRWGLVIDLDACTGCSACAAACYIENNVPIVGLKEHLKGREMSWLRIEGYYNDPLKPEFIPVMCQQCDNAPCETVCPVFATYHNPEGLNAQVYNRCVGTRYCANNCPYKVRRFNWFDRSHSLPLFSAFNPDISVRPRGVMEKCMFCIQRIRAARDKAGDENRSIMDGEVITACAQTCPANAITFGNLLDVNSRVYALAMSKGAYRVLELLGTEPAVYYIKRKKNAE